jgi:hypothetical protein
MSFSPGKYICTCSLSGAKKVRGQGPRETDEFKGLKLIKQVSNVHTGIDTILLII